MTKQESGNAYGFLLKNGSTEEYYYYIFNAQGDIIGIVDSTGTLVVEYTYSAWGEILSITGSETSTIGRLNPLRYRGYYYDNESGLYYLQSRYYDPVTGRFLNPDNISAGVGDSVQGYNLFAYCFNNPVNMEDDSGNWPKWLKKAAEVVKETAKSIAEKIGNTYKKILNSIKSYGIIKYDVPLYKQKGNLCWAYCQTMIEDYNSGITRTQEEADERAKEIAIDRHGESNWNQPGWPSNLGKRVSIKNNLFLLIELKKGPIYGYYASNEGAHLIVITGINIWTGEIYTNNPWGVSGSQSRDEFSQGFFDMPSDWNMRFICGYRIK